MVYTAAPLKRVEHPLWRWVGEVEEVRGERAEDIHERAVLRALESQMDRCAEAEEVEDIKEQIRLAMECMASSKGREQPRWIVPPDPEEEHWKEALARARRVVEGKRKQCLEVEEDPEGERPSKSRGLRRGRGGQMRFIVGDGDVGEQQGGEESQVREEQGSEPGQEANGRVAREEDGEGVEEGAAEEGEQENAGGDRVAERDSGGGAERAGKGTAESGEEKRTSRSHQRGSNMRRTRMGGQRGSGRGGLGTQRKKWAGRSRERCEKG